MLISAHYDDPLIEEKGHLKFYQNTGADFMSKIEEPTFTVSPNPGQSQSRITGPFFSQYSIFNVQTQLVKSGTARIIDIRELVPGLYFLTIVSNGTVEIVKLMKE